MGAGTGETAVSNFYRPLLCEFRRQWIHLLLHRLRFPSLAQNFAITMRKCVKAWPNARNISTQHLATLLHDVATVIERAGQTHATFITTCRCL